MKVNNNHKRNFDFSGLMKTIPPDIVFQMCHQASLSGHLYLKNGECRATFTFDSGRLTSGSLMPRFKKLGERLIGINCLSPAQLNECLHIQKNCKKKIGNILLEKGYISDKVLDENLRAQIRDTFFTVLTWDEGIFAFQSNTRPMLDKPTISERVDHLLLKGALLLDEKGHTTALLLE